MGNRLARPAGPDGPLQRLVTITVDRDVPDATVWPSRIVRIVARCDGRRDGRQTGQAAAAGANRGLWRRVGAFPVCPCWTGRERQQGPDRESWKSTG